MQFLLSNIAYYSDLILFQTKNINIKQKDHFSFSNNFVILDKSIKWLFNQKKINQSFKRLFKLKVPNFPWSLRLKCENQHFPPFLCH